METTARLFYIIFICCGFAALYFAVTKQRERYNVAISATCVGAFVYWAAYLLDKA